jgi:DNA (cytosine-5)-methyltransferase 1
MPGVRASVAAVTSYIERLDAAWADHLAPRSATAPTVISTFAGCGGSSLGYSMAGFREVLAVEWDDNAVETFRLNFPDVPVYHGDIAKLSVEDTLARTGLAVGELDVFDGSPPCQGFSTAGKRAIDDPRNGLFREYVRLLRGLQPRAFVMENVSGMVKGKMKLVFAEILRELKACGYRVSAQLLNAAYFGVPQNRQRMILIGVRDDLATYPTHPKAITQPMPVSVAFDLVINTADDLATPTAWGTNPRRAVSTYIPRIRPGKSCDDVHPKKAGYNLVRLDASRTSPTIPKTCNGSLFAGILPPSGNRYCTIPEIKRLGSFPDAFSLVGGFEQQWARIGNSVPPLFMRSIAQHIRDNIFAPTTAQAVAD